MMFHGSRFIVACTMLLFPVVFGGCGSTPCKQHASPTAATQAALETGSGASTSQCAMPELRKLDLGQAVCIGGLVFVHDDEWVELPTPSYDRLIYYNDKAICRLEYRAPVYRQFAVFGLPDASAGKKQLIVRTAMRYSLSWRGEKGTPEEKIKSELKRLFRAFELRFAPRVDRKGAYYSPGSTLELHASSVDLDTSSLKPNTP